MAITIIQKPPLINLNGNNNIWEIGSDTDNVIYYVVQLINSNNNIIINQKYYPRPHEENSKISINVSPFLTTDNTIRNVNYIATYTKLDSYQIVIKEYINNNGVIQQGDEYVDSELYYFFEGAENNIDYLKYHYNKYNINEAGKAQFLTNTRNNKAVLLNQNEFLQVFNLFNLAKKVTVYCYNNEDELITEASIDIVENQSVINLNVSPSVIFNHTDIKAHKALIKKYKVVILDANNVEKTESKIYKIVNSSCITQQTNIVYKNRLGGWDSVIFNNRIETITIDKKYYSKNEIFSSNIFLNNKEILAQNATSTYSASSDLLDDYESKHIKELLLSNKVYVAIGNYLVEVIIENKTYKVLQRHVNGYRKNRLEILFTTPFTIEDIIEVIDEDDDALYLINKDGNNIIDNYYNDIVLLQSAP